MLTDNGKLLLNFFCQSVEEVIAINETNAAKTPATGIVEPISKPKTKAAPMNPKIIPIHCYHVTFSFSNGPAKIFVKFG